MTNVLYLPDLGNGQYRNPVLFCDYSDPDAIRVGDTYYMTASSFNYVPGLPILGSKDLVNWELVNYALDNIPAPNYEIPRHADGVWAPAIRQNNGYFYIFYGMPDEGIYMVRAKDALEKWDEPVLILPGKGLIDPCPFWDDDGSAYVIHGYAKSRAGFNSRLGIFPISPDGKRAIGDDRLLFDGTKDHPTIEGPKVYKKDGWYYIFAPAGGVAAGWQTVLRSRNIMGPYEDRVVLRQGDTVINGPHQGAWVDTPNGENWFLHFQSRGIYGRITHLQPMIWNDDGWPVIGEPVEGEHWGKPVDINRKPEAPHCEPLSLSANDDFCGSLGLQWQFMGNRNDDFYSLENGALRLFAVKQPDDSGILWHCPNVLTQKIACPAFEAEVDIDVSGLMPGEQAGFALVGGQYAYVALRRTAEGEKLVFVQSEGDQHEEKNVESVEYSNRQVHFRLKLCPTGYNSAEVSFEYSENGEYRKIGVPFKPSRHTWVGARMALFAMPTDGGAHGGYSDFKHFTVTPTE